MLNSPAKIELQSYASQVKYIDKSVWACAHIDNYILWHHFIFLTSNAHMCNSKHLYLMLTNFEQHRVLSGKLICVMLAG